MTGAPPNPDGPISYTDEVAYGDRVISFSVVRADRSTLGIEVNPTGVVEVRAPREADTGEVRSRVQRRARWIAKSQRRFEELVVDTPKKEYVGGETHRYLGRQYRIKVMPLDQPTDSRIEGGGDPEGVRLVGRYFEVRTSRPSDPSHTRALLDRWYAAKAKLRLRERFELGCVVMAAYGIEPPPFQIRRMKTRWGSCTATGRILLNPTLILAPTACIDYVVAHELCHLIHPHHGREFYALLDCVMPDWRDRKARLEGVQ